MTTNIHIPLTMYETFTLNERILKCLANSYFDNAELLDGGKDIRGSRVTMNALDDLMKLYGRSRRRKGVDPLNRERKREK